MTLKDLLKKKDKLQPEGESGPFRSEDGHLNADANANPEGFTFIRTTTHSREVISPPSFPGDETTAAAAATRPRSSTTTSHKRRSNLFRRSVDLPTRTDDSSGAAGPQSPPPAATSKGERRLSSRLHLHSRSRSVTEGSSAYVPENLPDIRGQFAVKRAEDQGEWEQRATLLAKGSIASSAPNSPRLRARSSASSAAGESHGGPMPTIVVDQGGDDSIQEAIRLHEAGDLERSTALFGRLADPEGANNALSQVLYGLALRHGWGVAPDLERAVTYLSQAASNSAEVESLALQAGMKKGGSAKGELVLAIFELANCFRNGWGIKKDPNAAKQYYETAANLGDTDAMNEVAWCYLEGFGCKKDKFKASQYLRLAEESGHKTLGNSWTHDWIQFGGERWISHLDSSSFPTLPSLSSIITNRLNLWRMSHGELETDRLQLPKHRPPACRFSKHLESPQPDRLAERRPFLTVDRASALLGFSTFRGSLPLPLLQLAHIDGSPRLLGRNNKTPDAFDWMPLTIIRVLSAVQDASRITHHSEARRRYLPTAQGPTWTILREFFNPDGPPSHSVWLVLQKINWH